MVTSGRWTSGHYRPRVQPERGQDIGQGRPCVQEEIQGGHKNPPREVCTDQGHLPGHPNYHPATGVT